MFEGVPLMVWLYLLVLAILVGYEIISKVPPILHTPLMSGSNAVSGISLIGALVVSGVEGAGLLTAILGLVAVAMAMVNVIGGFLVTDRMLQMFRREPGEGGRSS